MRRVIAGFVAILAMALAVATVLVLRPTTALAPPASPEVSPTASPTATPSLSPTPTPQSLYMSKRIGFALTLPPPWRKASCGNSDPGRIEPPFFEDFTSAPVMEEHIGHAGRSNDRVAVRLDPNSQGLSPTQFAQSRYPNAPVTSVTFAGRPAVEVRPDLAGEGLFYLMAEGDRMYTVGYWPRTSGVPDLATMLQILRSFRFLSIAERPALPDPTPIPVAAGSAEALAGMLKTALEQKDVAALDRLLGPCVSQGVRPGGGASEPRERFVAELRQQLAAGLTVTVDASAIRTDTQNNYTYVSSQWNAAPPGGGAPPQSPGPQTLNVQLIFGQTQGGLYWSGTLVVFSF